MGEADGQSGIAGLYDSAVQMRNIRPDRNQPKVRRFEDDRRGNPYPTDQRALHPSSEAMKSNTAAPAKKPLPVFGSDEEAERFVDTADLKEYDLSGGMPMRQWLSEFEQFNKDRSMHFRLTEGMLAALRAGAEKRKIPVQRYMRELLERGLTEDQAVEGVRSRVSKGASKVQAAKVLKTKAQKTEAHEKRLARKAVKRKAVTRKQA